MVRVPHLEFDVREHLAYTRVVAASVSLGTASKCAADARCCASPPRTPDRRTASTAGATSGGCSTRWQSSSASSFTGSLPSRVGLPAVSACTGDAPSVHARAAVSGEPHQVARAPRYRRTVVACAPRSGRRCPPAVARRPNSLVECKQGRCWP